MAEHCDVHLPWTWALRGEQHLAHIARRRDSLAKVLDVEEVRMIFLTGFIDIPCTFACKLWPGLEIQ